MEDSVNELTLDEMLADPIVQTLMRRDGVEPQDVRAVIADVRHRRKTAVE
jgi:hypothetical protein